MVFCSISNCGNSSKIFNHTNKGITFHMFPKDPDIKDNWITATGKRNWFPTKYSRICSAHFTDEQFNSSTKRRTLIKTAVPIVDIMRLITVTDDLKPTTDLATPSTSLRKCELSEIVDSADNEQLTSALSDFIQVDTPREKKLRSEIVRSRVVIAAQRLKIKRLQCKVRRYSKQILKLKDLIKNLEDKSLITEDQGCCLENMNARLKVQSKIVQQSNV